MGNMGQGLGECFVCEIIINSTDTDTWVEINSKNLIHMECISQLQVMGEGVFELMRIDDWMMEFSEASD